MVAGIRGLYSTLRHGIWQSTLTNFNRALLCLTSDSFYKTGAIYRGVIKSTQGWPLSPSGLGSVLHLLIHADGVRVEVYSYLHQPRMADKRDPGNAQSMAWHTTKDGKKGCWDFWRISII